ncbi:carotenoid oxygenase family protein [Halioglobus sp. Uisw_031]|uniref:carotenoid oxygenase family protein n=1 Tax=Halioglobus sp. Uisw_031 TaxID=3230977 RepID=UPI0039E839B3
MLSIALIVIAVLFLAPPLLFLVCLKVAPRPLLQWVDNRAYKALDVDAYNRNSPYNAPGFKPVHTLCSNAVLQVSGKIPDDLEGVYLRNGTNLQFEQTNGRYHMFNGAGMLHQVQIKGGKASYSNTYVKTPRYQIEDAMGQDQYLHFGDLAGGGKAGLVRMAVAALKQRSGVLPALEVLESGSSTTAVQYHHSKLYCLQETGYPFALNTRLENGYLILDGEGEWDNFSGKLDGPFTAHPKIDPVTGDWYTFSTQFSSGRLYHSVVRQGKLVQHSVIDQQKPALAFLHDYYLTEHYLVFPDLSLRFNPKDMFGPEKSPMVFDADYKMRWGIIKRDHQPGDPVRWFTTEQPGHLWHVVNGWEETRDDGGTDIVLFAPVFRSYPSNLPIHNPQEPHAKFNKWRLNLDSGQVTEDRVLLDHFYERPSFNTAYIGRQNRYAYLLDEEKEGMMARGVLKYDMVDEREVAYFDYGEFYGGEALFVPRMNASGEDDGYLLELLMMADRAELLIIDAATMQEMARLHLPQRVPFGVHSCWLNQEKVASLA